MINGRSLVAVISTARSAENVWSLPGRVPGRDVRSHATPGQTRQSIRLLRSKPSPTSVCCCGPPAWCFFFYRTVTHDDDLFRATMRSGYFVDDSGYADFDFPGYCMWAKIPGGEAGGSDSRCCCGVDKTRIRFPSFINNDDARQRGSFSSMTMPVATSFCWAGNGVTGQQGLRRMMRLLL